MDGYYAMVKEFISWLKHLEKINEENAEIIITKIMTVYIASTELIYPETVSEKDCNYKTEALSIACKKYSFYWEIFDPYSLDEAVCGSLIDDLSDIYNDIQEGVYLYECGMKADAVWRWKWNFENHWKYHATDAIRALCRIG